MKSLHGLGIQEALEQLGSRPEGLTSAEVAERAARYGKNALREKPKKSLALRIWEQVREPMVLILAAAAIVSGAIGHLSDAVIILGVVAINTTIGLVQAGKAERAIDALKKMGASTAQVVRDDASANVAAEDLVPGDIVVLDAGDMIPADLRLIESSSLKIEEAALTGESVPSEKDALAVQEEDTPLADRVNMAWNGTSVTYGRGVGVVCAIGMETEMGRIAEGLEDVGETETPLQRKLAEIGKVMTVVVVVLCAVIFGLAVWKDGDITRAEVFDAFMTSVSLAVAAIPEGLPAVVTIVMAIGVGRLAKRRAIVRRLSAVETLGGTQVICSDKTGTLTQNKMDVRELCPEGTCLTAEEYRKVGSDPLLENILFLCNDSELTPDGEIGDPTETALKRFVLESLEARGGDRVAALEAFEKKERVADLPFDSERKMMTSVNRMEDGAVLVLTKGAPDEVLRACNRVRTPDGVRDLNDERRDAILAVNHAMAAKALRVLGTAYRDHVSGEPTDGLEKNLIFVGLIGMMDPPRPEVPAAIGQCREAGIVPIMITGDHRDTAVAIAREVGLFEDGHEALSGRELDALPDAELNRRLENIRVYARVSPENKVRIVKAWRGHGKVVAMTGDGVNDAPALKTADIGVGMGITGTDVSKSVADMLLSDDNFATIVSAVEEGRKIYANIRKVVLFLLATNASEVLSILLATLFFPEGVVFLVSVQLLWVNLIIESFPAIGLGMERLDGEVMSEPPRDARQNFFADGLGLGILRHALVLSALTLSAWIVGHQYSHPVATTTAFAVLSIAPVLNGFNIKRGDETVFSRKTLDNPTMLLGLAVAVLLTFLVVEVETLGVYFKVVPLTAAQWVVVGLISLTPVLLEETRKWMKRRGWKGVRYNASKTGR